MSRTTQAAIVKQSYNGVQEIRIESELLTKRNIMLTDEIDRESANRFMTELMYLISEGNEEINLYINSGGGEINAGLLIYDLIQSSTAPINIYCTGMAASMAAILLASGQKGRRFILPHSKVMIHEPLISGGVGGSATSIKNISDSIMETRKLVNEILAKHTGKTRKEIEKATAYDHYMSAEEAVEFGICDEIKKSPFR